MTEVLSDGERSAIGIFVHRYGVKPPSELIDVHVLHAGVLSQLYVM
jgi:hypothetical protein